jgi:GTPase SAR1 family protein|tara:strand:- start:121 stop:327 length:207 start_codon:yes stop_codon:yes gene_type:complete
MKFTDSQIFFINDSIRKELNEQEIFLKYLTDLAQKENDLVKKNKINKSVELCVQKIQELEALRGLLHE